MTAISSFHPPLSQPADGQWYVKLWDETGDLTGSEALRADDPVPDACDA